MVSIMRRSISFLRTSLALTSSLSARSLTVMPSASVMSLVIGGGASWTNGADGRSSRRGPPRGRGGGGRKGGRGGRRGRLNGDLGVRLRGFNRRGRSLDRRFRGDGLDLGSFDGHLFDGLRY